MILGSVLRYGVRREEEIGARLSNTRYMGVPAGRSKTGTDMSAMQFRRAVAEKEMAPLRGAEPE